MRWHQTLVSGKEITLFWAELKVDINSGMSAGTVDTILHTFRGKVIFSGKKMETIIN